MKKIILSLALVTGAAVMASQPNQPAIGALPPHPLDKAFERVTTERQASDALLNNELYKKAIKEALKAKQNSEEQKRKNPNIVSSTPAQAARKKFLEVLADAEQNNEVGKAGAIK